MDDTDKSLISALAMTASLGGNMFKEFKTVPCKTCQYKKMGLETICEKYKKRIPSSVKENKQCKLYQEKEWFDLDERYKRRHLDKWVSNESYHEAYKLWLYYNYKCEVYDSQVCSAVDDRGFYVPTTAKESQRIQKYANEQLKYIETKRIVFKNIGIEISNTEWQSAKSHFARHTLEELKKEYQYYFGDKKNPINLIEIIKNATEVNYTLLYPIKDFTIESLSELSKLAKEKKIELRIRRESSNMYQGTLLEVQRFYNRVDCRMSDEKWN